MPFPFKSPQSTPVAVRRKHSPRPGQPHHTSDSQDTDLSDDVAVNGVAAALIEEQRKARAGQVYHMPSPDRSPRQSVQRIASIIAHRGVENLYHPNGVEHEARPRKSTTLGVLYQNDHEDADVSKGRGSQTDRAAYRSISPPTQASHANSSTTAATIGPDGKSDGEIKEGDERNKESQRRASLFGLPDMASVVSAMSAMSPRETIMSAMSPNTNTSARTWTTTSSEALQNGSPSVGVGSVRSHRSQASSVNTPGRLRRLSDHNTPKSDPDAHHRQHQRQHAEKSGTVLPIASARSPPRRLHNRQQSVISPKGVKSPNRGLHKKRSSWNFNACCSCCRRNSKKDDEKTVIKDARDLHGNLAFNNNGIGNNGYGATMTGDSPQEAYRQGLAIQEEVYFTRI